MTTSNDGVGSGYDADLLDGQEGSYYRNASNLNAGTVPSARLSGSYNISITGTAPAPNLDSLTNVTITNPQNNDVLQYNGSAWVNGASSITGLQSRASVSATYSVGANGFVDATIVTPKSYMLWKVEVNYACWLRLYCDTNSRTADQGRNNDSDPLPGSGVLAEVISSGQTVQLITPGTLCFNSAGSNATYLRVDDRSGGTNNHTITLRYLQLELIWRKSHILSLFIEKRIYLPSILRWQKRFRLHIQRPLSRNTHYWMTVQAEELRQDERVWDS